MPSKEKSYAVGSPSSCGLNNSHMSSSQTSNSSNRSIKKKKKSTSSSGSDSEKDSNASISQRSTNNSQITNSQQSNRSNSSVGSEKGHSQSQMSNKSGSDNDSSSDSLQKAGNSQRSNATNSQRSNKSTSSVRSEKTQSQSQNSNNSGSDSDPNSDQFQELSPNHSNVTNSQKSKKLGHFSDSDDSAQNDIIKTVKPLEESDSDSIINSNKKSAMSKSSIRKLLEDDSSSASDSKNSTLKLTELCGSDDSNKSSSGTLKKKEKKIKIKRRIVKHAESGSSDEESSVRKTRPSKSSATFLTEPSTVPTVPDWKKSMGTGLLDDSSSEDERGLVQSPVQSSDNETIESPKPQIKKSRKTKENSTNNASKKSYKVAKQDVEEIHSESQRHRRVERAELPYHVPRQRSLAEFMARRPILPAATSKSLKMPAWQLKAHWKQMAEQEKEATEFFKSESDHSEDETEKSLSQVSAILSKTLQDTPTEQEKSAEKSIIDKKSPEKSKDAPYSADSIAATSIEIEKITEVVDNASVDKSLESASNKKITEAVTKDFPPKNDLHSFDEKIMINSEINCCETSSSKQVPLSAETNKLNGKEDPAVEKHENISELCKDDKVNDYSSDSDVELRLSDSEDEKEKERPTSKIERGRASSTDLKVKKESGLAKPAFGAGFSDVISSDGENETAGNKNPANESDKNKDHLGDKKLAMLRRRGLMDIANIKPRLSGSQNDIIDLDEDVASKREGVMDLMQRFLKHSSKKKPKVEKTEVELSIVSAEKGADGIETVSKELMTIMLGEEEESRDPVPGAKLQRLRQTLQKQMAMKRNAEWERKMEEKRINSEVLGDADGETSDCGMLDEETEMTDSEDDADEGVDDEEVDNEDADDEEADDEEEEEEIDGPTKEKKRPQSEFLDDEADESDEGDEGDADGSGNESGDEDEEETKEDGKDSDVEKEKEAKTIDDPIDKGASKSSQSKSKFKRLQTFDMFDSEDDLETSIVDKWAAMETNAATTPTSPVIPAGQGTESPAESQFLVSPMIFNRRSGPTQESPSGSPLVKTSSKTDDENCFSSTQDFLNEIMKGTTVKPKETGRVSTLSKFLFKANSQSTQADEDELLSLCSGKFDTQVDRSADDELAELCSGRFSTQTQAQLENGNESQGRSQAEPDVDDFSQDAQDVNVSSQKKPVSTVKATVKPWVDLVIASSDDEDEKKINRSDGNVKKKTQKKLNFSDDDDDEDEAAEAAVSEDEGPEDEEADSAEEAEPELVDYDSEENEVPANGEKKRLAAKEFFDAEAELTESEWGSADEDEKDLDKLDYAAADEEQFDQEQMKEQLDKIHMRQVLDADKREVRMLQEMLFEDGDLHTDGGGRERKFRWKNTDNDDMNVGLRGDSGDEGAAQEEEAEDEEKWRIMRHERETFLREQKEKAEAAGKEDQGILEDEDSQFLKLGKAALKRIRSVHSQEQVAIERKITLRKSVSDVLLSPDAKRMCNPVVQRGSFLARGESALARIAAITRGTAGKVVLNAKNSRNFVFATISPKEEEVDIPVNVPGKRKASAVTPTLVKKVKVTDDKSKGRRLFDHLK